MKVSLCSRSFIWEQLRTEGLTLSMPPFVVRIRSDVPSIAFDIARLYADFQVLEVDSFVDFHVELSFLPRRLPWQSPKIQFFFDGEPSFSKLSADQAFPTLEWGLNWCIAAHSHQYLVLHAAVIERGGAAVLLPAPPGSGKSTLCAALVNRGWRLLSDELALLELNSGLVYGCVRPVSLKNRSIEVIRAFEPGVVMTEPVDTDSKGMVALMKPPENSVRDECVPAVPKWIIVPKYEQEVASRLEAYNPAEAFLLLAEQSFNYELHGARGFEAVGELLDSCRCARFVYSDLDDAIKIFSDLEEAFQ